MAVTDRGKGWEIRNSIFVVFTFFLGLGNWSAFLICGWLAKQRKWMFYALIYAIPLILTIIMGKLTDLTFYAMVISGIISIIHIFKIREEFLVRYDRLLKLSETKYLDNVDVDKLIYETRKGSENISNKDESVKNKDATITQQSKNIVSNEENHIKDDNNENKGRMIDF